VQANVVALRILEAGEVAEAAGDLCAWDEDGDTEFFGALEGGVELAVGVEVDERAIGCRLLVFAVNDTAADAAFLGGEEAAGLIAGPGVEFEVEDGFVEVSGALEVGGRDLEPGDCVVVELTHGVSPVGLRWVQSQDRRELLTALCQEDGRSGAYFVWRLIFEDRSYLGRATILLLLACVGMIL
jgi:hypothetical protein